MKKDLIKKDYKKKINLLNRYNQKYYNFVRYSSLIN